MGRLIIDGNSVFEIDEECVKQKNPPENCDIKKYLQKTPRKKEKKPLSKKQKNEAKLLSGNPNTG
uniref:hypothetical protein n=1 Tax=Agathobacter sp. TaxID=2021311 RepID=UPI004056ECB6